MSRAVELADDLFASPPVPAPQKSTSAANDRLNPTFVTPNAATESSPPSPWSLPQASTAPSEPALSPVSPTTRAYAPAVSPVSSESSEEEDDEEEDDDESPMRLRPKFTLISTHKPAGDALLARLNVRLAAGAMVFSSEESWKLCCVEGASRTSRAGDCMWTFVPESALTPSPPDDARYKVATELVGREAGSGSCPVRLNEAHCCRAGPC